MQYLFVNVGCNNELRRIEQLSLEFWITSKKATKSQQILIRLKKKQFLNYLIKLCMCLGKIKLECFHINKFGCREKN